MDDGLLTIQHAQSTAAGARFRRLGVEPSRRVGFTCAGAIHTGGCYELVIDVVGGEARVNITSTFIRSAGRRSGLAAGVVAGCALHAREASLC